MMKSMTDAIIEVLTITPWLSVKEIADKLPERNASRVAERLTRLYNKKAIQRFYKPFKYALLSTPPVPGIPIDKIIEKEVEKVPEQSPPKSDGNNFPEHLVIVHRKKQEFRKGFDNFVDVNEYLETLEETDVAGVYRRMECQKKTIWKIQ